MTKRVTWIVVSVLGLGVVAAISAVPFFQSVVAGEIFAPATIATIAATQDPDPLEQEGFLWGTTSVFVYATGVVTPGERGGDEES
jgi:hypothetical protein